jgi:signal transduction histidine kinase
MMNIDILLDQIQPKWFETVSKKLSSENIVRESFVEQLERYYSSMKRAISTGDPTQIETVLEDWVQAKTRSDLERHETGITLILSQMLVSTHEIAGRCLQGDEALTLLGVLIPIYNHAYEYVNRRETEIQIEYVSSELEKANLVLERLDRSKSNFIAVAAHELKTPLTLIEGYASMLREHLPRDFRETLIAQLLNGVNNGARRLQEIVDNLIDISMIDNNMLSLNYQPVWINRLLKLVYNDLEAAIQQRKLIFKIREFPGSEEMFYADPERLLQAFRNLVINAIKYTPDGGRIVIDGRTLPGFIEVKVTDTGIGINPEDHDRIFEKMDSISDTNFHSSGKIKFKGGGPGLGLPITKGLIEAHKGSIWVESDGYDEDTCPGATFHVLLPKLQEHPGDQSAKLFENLSLEQIS